MSSGAKILWMQLGVRSEKAEQIAKAAGIIVVQDRWELLGIS
jgi:predicted CoA-binding protein